MKQRHKEFLQKTYWLAFGALLGLWCLGEGALPARAQAVPFEPLVSANNVANTGLSELMATMIWQAKASCGTETDTNCITTAGTLVFHYPTVPIDNSLTSGITVCERIGGTPVCGTAGVLLDGTFTATSDTVSFGIKEGVNLAAGDQVQIAGVRGRIAGSLLQTIGTEGLVEASSSPASVASFTPSSVVVARSADPLLLQITAVPPLPCQDGDAEPLVILTE
jgi:hypothetical protein